MPGNLSPDTVSRLWLPRPALSACMRGVLGRDTRAAVLDGAQRFNHLAAAPLCWVFWQLEGVTEQLPPGAPASLSVPRQPLPSPILFGGPATVPTLTWNPGPSHGLMLLLTPDAAYRLTGLPVPEWVNRHADARAVLPPDWVAMCEAVRAAPDDEARVACMQDFLEPRWQAVRPALPLQGHRYLDWAQSLAMRAALSGPGKSLRQVERRIKSWAGLPMRSLLGLGRAERAFFNALAAGEQGPPNLAEVADASGYADQPHLSREVRRVTGFSPMELYRRIQEEESFWSYRVWQ
ncbi:helix-turn-helix domain-containing protein [Azohydromonas caseinilytica]|uniref:Helix-turn-helix transcriptional regulator n=1 Tax=Azohydromonas caseinilytica TaxID=2728836 RepID=A0A848F7I3_9BURK|nr:AraC family transcriptional regulator [Azohydromonas caseinilytica]NML15534.1 helix-turn-helix transcriptional regulator [Azohydromonas caseinilytica]